MPSRRIAALLLTLLATFATTASLAHDFSLTDTLVLLKTDGTFVVDMRLDVDALALGAAPATDDAELVAALRALDDAGLQAAVDRATRTLRRRVRARFDDDKIVPHVDFPDRELPWIESAEPPTVLGITARLTGRMPDDAQQFRFGASRAFGPLRVTLVDQSTGRSETHLLGAGEDTPLFALGTAPTAQSGSVVWRYVALGFEHIVPLGADHILFVLGLFLLSTRMRPLLVQVTAFTVAHTVTLALSMRGVVSLPSGPVEALIALSIAYVAIENLVTTELKPWRPALVFAFGLLHGLGFAEVLRELGLPDDRFAGALIGFNVGVELGQLAVIGIAFLVVGRFRDRDWYRSRVVVPASLLIAAAGLWWCITRTF